MQVQLYVRNHKACVSHLIVPEPGVIWGIIGTGMAAAVTMGCVGVWSLGASDDMTGSKGHHDRTNPPRTGEETKKEMERKGARRTVVAHLGAHAHHAYLTNTKGEFALNEYI